MDGLSIILLIVKWVLTLLILTAAFAVVIDHFFPVRIIGLTGSIACGKSTVANIIRRRLTDQLHITDFDRLGHQALDAGTAGHTLIRKRFGNEICAHDWTIDRKKLGDICFRDQKKLKFLNSVVRPQIIMLFVWELLKEVFWERRSIVLLDAPLLFESGLNYVCDKTIAVVLDKDAQIARLVYRDNCDVDLAIRKIDAQMSSEKKGLMADIQIDNNQNLKQLNHRTKLLLEEKPFKMSDRPAFEFSPGKLQWVAALMIATLAVTFHIPEVFFTIIVVLTVVLTEIFIRIR